MEEIGSRATIFELEGLGSEKRKYLKWLLAQSVVPKIEADLSIKEQALQKMVPAGQTAAEIKTRRHAADIPCFTLIKIKCGASSPQIQSQRTFNPLTPHFTVLDIWSGFGIKAPPASQKRLRIAHDNYPPSGHSILRILHL
jgi:hypothetical protein